MPTPANKKPQFKKFIYMVGVGILPDRHISRQALDIVSNADCVVCFFDPALENLLNTLPMKSNLLYLDDLYHDGGIDDENYDRILAFVTSLLSNHNKIAFICPGSPRLGISLADMLNSAQTIYNFELKIIAGISSFETMTIDMKCDPLELGTVIIDANRWLLFDYSPSIELNHFIYHVCSVSTRTTNYSNAGIHNRIDLLQESLLRSYPGNHHCALVSSTGDDATAVINHLTIEKLSSHLKNITFDTTLYIPGIRPTMQNEKILGLLQSMKQPTDAPYLKKSTYQK